jgi:sulfur carrier protein ThiS
MKVTENQENKVETKPQPNHVTITINGKPYEVHPGNHPVVELKNKAGIPKEDTLCVMVNGEPKPLDDKAHVQIVGEEVFASNCPSGGAS